MRITTKLNLVFDPSFSKYPEVKNKMIGAADKLEEVINTKEFIDFILSHRYQNEYCFADCIDDNARVALNNTVGAEMLSPEEDNEWDLIVIPYYKRWSRAIGYTYPSRKEIWVNMKFYNKKHWTEGDIAGNLAHEYQHKLGYKHSFKRQPNWGATVPYAIGSYCQRMVNNMNDDLTTEFIDAVGLNHMAWYRRVWYKITRFIF